MEPGVMQGIVGGILGSLIGVLGGGVGCYFSIRNTNGPRERAFVVKCVKQSVLFVLGFLLVYGVACVLVFLLRTHVAPGWSTVLLVLPHLLWIPYVIALVYGILHWNKEQARIRREEAQEADRHETR